MGSEMCIRDRGSTLLTEVAVADPIFSPNINTPFNIGLKKSLFGYRFYPIFSHESLLYQLEGSQKSSKSEVMGCFLKFVVCSYQI